VFRASHALKDQINHGAAHPNGGKATMHRASSSGEMRSSRVTSAKLSSA
jgi:hypothetical protein